MKPCVYAFIFARGGSKGVPRKNIRPLAGKPLIAYAIEIGLQSDLINRVIVSTDDHKIANVAMQYGAEVPFMRPKDLGRDDSPEWLAWRHAIEETLREPGSRKMDIFVSLPPISPLRSIEDVNTCIKAFIESDADITITIKNASRHPSFNMVFLDDNGYAQLVMPPEKALHRRQDTSVVYDMTTVAYVTRPDYILKADSHFEGKVKTVIIPEERALDIDTELDFAFAEFMMNRVKSD